VEPQDRCLGEVIWVLRILAPPVCSLQCQEAPADQAVPQQIILVSETGWQVRLLQPQSCRVLLSPPPPSSLQGKLFSW